ncbi:MAG: cupin domain-containing protein [Lachnospiraceae bacterium]|nr:cupin domain-containing protein [Lachnospiraceae bacterium]
MNVNGRMIVRNLYEIPFVPTSHDIGKKQVLLSNTETESKITQIAKTVLPAESVIEQHAHPSMDEHFLFLCGEGEIIIDETILTCVPGLFVLVPATTKHYIIAKTELCFMTFSVAL